MPLETIGHLNGRVDENNSLIIADVAAGTAGPRTAGLNARATSTTTTAYLNVADNAAGASRTPRTALGNLGIKADATSVYVARVTAGTPGPATVGGNIRGRTDENGSLIVAEVAVGSTLGPIKPISQLMLKADENDAIIIAIGP